MLFDKSKIFWPLQIKRKFQKQKITVVFLISDFLILWEMVKMQN